MIEGFILAGGRSRRFGQDKLLYLLGRKSLVEHALDSLRSLCGKIYIVAKDTRKFHFLKDVELLQDKMEKQFVLSGLYTALVNLKGEKGLVVAGDMPLLRESLLKRLVKRSAPPLTLFRVCGRLQPLPGVYYGELLPELEAYIKQGGERLLDFVESVPYKEIGEEEARECDPGLLSFLNVNTREDAEFILNIYGREVFEG
ncbi:MAG: molybdenum cofactor guanylyltransferase [Aquificaceae bacterium]|nr:molybdenum cofactor guanylyltransferase [Aquificaceae bacterium]MDW8293770.1 molybdenum cofactor guanylyltransferase [Aquificaceae bacterium]